MMQGVLGCPVIAPLMHHLACYLINNRSKCVHTPPTAPMSHFNIRKLWSALAGFEAVTSEYVCCTLVRLIFDDRQNDSDD